MAGVETKANLPPSRELLEVVDRLIRDRILPRASAIDASDRFPTDVFEAMAGVGLLEMWVPEDYGGLGTDLRTNLLVVERIARASAACALIFSQCGDGATTLLLGGSRRVLEQYLPRVATGEVIPCVAMTEPDAGSDVAAMRTTAVRAGDEYVINGRKTFCTCGSVGGVYLVCAKTDPGAGNRGISMFVVPRAADGLILGRDEELMGLRGCPTSEIILEEVTVPSDALVGAEGDGFRIAMMALDDARLNAAAQALGIARGAVELAIGYARERRAFGQEIIKHQGLQFVLAEVATDITAGAALLDTAIAKLEEHRSREASTAAAMAKLFCTEVGMRATIEAVQVFGGSGVSKSLPLERMMRDIKAYQIFDGTTQIQKSVIGRYLERTGHLPLEMS